MLRHILTYVGKDTSQTSHAEITPQHRIYWMPLKLANSQVKTSLNEIEILPVKGLCTWSALAGN